MTIKLPSELPRMSSPLPFDPSKVASMLKPLGSSGGVPRILDTLSRISSENERHASNVRRMSQSIENDVVELENLIGDVYSRMDAPEMVGDSDDSDLRAIFSAIRGLPQAYDKSDRHLAQDSISGIISHIESVVNDPENPIMDEDYLNNVSVALNGLIGRSVSLSMAWLMEDQQESAEEFEAGIGAANRIKGLMDSVKSMMDSRVDEHDAADKFGHGAA